VSQPHSAEVDLPRKRRLANVWVIAISDHAVFADGSHCPQLPTEFRSRKGFRNHVLERRAVAFGFLFFRHKKEPFIFGEASGSSGDYELWSRAFVTEHDKMDRMHVYLMLRIERYDLASDGADEGFDLLHGHVVTDGADDNSAGHCDGPITTMMVLAEDDLKSDDDPGGAGEV